MIWMIFVKILKNTIQLKSRKILIVFDDMIADTLSNKNLNPVVTELFIRGKKLIFFFLVVVPKNIILNSTHYFLIKVPNKIELQQIPLNHSSDINF